MINCSLCNEILKNVGSMPEDYQSLVRSGENVIFGSSQVVLVPSFGPLNNSHSMIVPRDHVNSVADLSEVPAEEVKDLVEQLRNKYKETYGKELVFFESGAGNLASHAGGCIVHAHIHCVEANIGFEEKLFEEVDFIELEESLNFSFDTDFGYVWYKGVNGLEYVRNKPLLPSQFLRYLYMQNSDNPQKWNWRRDIDILGVKKVLRNYSMLF